MKAKKVDGKLYFRNFVVIPEGKHFFGVYESVLNCKCGPLITSGHSFDAAAKKAKLLQMGYDIRRDMDEEMYYG